MTSHVLALHSQVIIPEPESSSYSGHRLNKQHKYIRFYFKIKIEKAAKKLISCLLEYKVYHRP